MAHFSRPAQQPSPCAQLSLSLCSADDWGPPLHSLMRRAHKSFAPPFLLRDKLGLSLPIGNLPPHAPISPRFGVASKPCAPIKWSSRCRHPYPTLVQPPRARARCAAAAARTLKRHRLSSLLLLPLLCHDDHSEHRTRVSDPSVYSRAPISSPTVCTTSPELYRRTRAATASSAPSQCLCGQPQPHLHVRHNPLSLSLSLSVQVP